MRYGPGISFCLVLCLACGSARAAVTGLQRLATGLNFPVYATAAPGDRDRLFVVEKGGAIKILNLKTNTVTGTFMTVSDTKATGDGGLQSMTFDPDYFNVGTPGYGKFYVDVTVDNGNTPVPGPIAGVLSPFSLHIRQYSVNPSNPNLGDASTKKEILSYVKPGTDHNGGWIGFNPKLSPGQPQYLYITAGDGGATFNTGTVHGDPFNNAQTIDNDQMGKILRVDVHGDDFPGDDNFNYASPPDNPFVGKAGDDDIWSYGLRNPWRASFDRDKGDFWIGDVGWDTREEIDHQAPGVGAQNYGWRLQEGNVQTPPPAGGPAPADYVAPVYDYTHGTTTQGTFQGKAVVGGYIYRGPDPSLQGQYFFGDEISKHFWRFTDPTNPTGTVQNIDSLLVPNVGAINAPASFGEDAVGNLYVVDYANTFQANQGEIYRVVTNALLTGDYNTDGTVDAADYTVWRDTLGQTVPNGTGADGNGNGMIDTDDYNFWANNFGHSVHTQSGSGAATAVPEPAAMALTFQMLGLCGIMYGVRRRRATRRRSAVSG
jgi:glucose/arabinose dehydrogenase